jgi:hypothetical protein
MKHNNTAAHFIVAVLAITLMLAGSSFAADTGTHVSSQFQGAKANKGTVTHSIRDGKSTLTLSDDFVVPDTPDPHWELVDSNGTVYLLDKLKLKGDRTKKEITVPSYVPNVAKVVIWCAWAEANLGEASFSSPIK